MSGYDPIDDCALISKMIERGKIDASTPKNVVTAIMRTSDEFKTIQMVSTLTFNCYQDMSYSTNHYRMHRHKQTWF